MSAFRTKLTALAAIAGAAIGGAAIANAATSSSSTTTSTTTPPAAQAPAAGQPPQGAPQGAPQGRHTLNGKTEEALSGDVAAKVKAAALAKVSGTVERVETNVDSSAP